MKSRPLQRDKLHCLKRDLVLPLVARALHPVQNESPEEMVASVSVLFALVCNRVGLDPQAMHHMATRMLRDEQHHDKSNKLLQSLRDFAGMRIRGQEVTLS